MDPITLSVIGGSALAGLGTSLFNTNQQRIANKQNVDATSQNNALQMEFAKQQAQLQRQWALEDWDRQNAFNSPQQQMQRLKEAGLNPHLIYGSGTATSTAQSVKSSPTPTPNTSAPQVTAPRMDMQNFSGPLDQIYRLHSMEIDMQNKEAQNELLELEAQSKTMDLSMKSKLFDSTFQVGKNKAEMSEWDKVNKTADNRLKNMIWEEKMQDWEFKNEMNPIKIKHAEKFLEQQGRQAELQNLELQLERIGISKNSPFFIKMYGRLLDRLIN